MSINNWIWRNFLSGRAFETKIDSNSSNIRIGGALHDFPNLSADLFMGRIRYSTTVSSVGLGLRSGRAGSDLSWPRHFSILRGSDRQQPQSA